MSLLEPRSKFSREEEAKRLQFNVEKALFSQDHFRLAFRAPERKTDLSDNYEFKSTI